MAAACRDVEAATLTRNGSPPITRTTFPSCRAHYPGGSSGCACRLLPRSCSLPQMAGGSASALSLSRPAQASLTLRPAGLLSRLKRPLSRGSSSAGYPAEPLVSYQINRQLSGWNLPPLVIRAFGRTANKRHCGLSRDFDSTPHFHCTHVLVEEPSTASEADIDCAKVRLSAQEKRDFFEETSRCNLLFQKEMVLAGESDEARTRNAGSQHPAALNGNHEIPANMHHKSRRSHFAYNVCNIEITSGVHIAGCAVGRRRSALQFIKEIGLFLRSLLE